MDTLDVRVQLAGHRLFGTLPPDVQQRLASHAVASTFAAGQVVLAEDAMAERLGWLVHGALELCDLHTGARLALRAQELFRAGVHAYPPAGRVHAVAAAGCQVLLLDSAALQQVAPAHPQLYLLLPALERPVAARAQMATAEPVGGTMNAPVGSLVQREPLVIDGSDSIRSAAQRMTDAGVSSLMVTEGTQLTGLITDRDLRRRVLAAGLDPARPVSDIATAAPLTLQRRQPVFDALLLMARANIHHLPVLEGERLVGMVTASDLHRLHSTSALHLTASIHRQPDLAGLVACSARVRQLQASLARAETSAHHSGMAMTSVTDAFTLRLIALAEQDLGPPPVGYAWVAAGSQARMEQTARTDQDNCLVLSDDYREPQHGAYFQALARFVCDGLDACGYVHCPGDIMATTEQWRQPRARWDAYFERWTRQPEPQALLWACVFFDLRAVHGKADLLRRLRCAMLERTQGSSLFLAHMVGNALRQRPPLGLFGQITASRSGSHPHTVDLKHGGIAPIVDLARIYALAAGVDAVGTHERLAAAADRGQVSPQAARDLRETLEFISALRIAHQTRQWSRGLTPDNHVRLDELSGFERSTLKDAFGVVQHLQDVLGQRYQAGRF